MRESSRGAPKKCSSQGSNTVKKIASATPATRNAGQITRMIRRASSCRMACPRWTGKLAAIDAREAHSVLVAVFAGASQRELQVRWRLRDPVQVNADTAIGLERDRRA